MKVLRNGQLIEENLEIPVFSEANTNELLDRSKVDNETKKQLAKLLEKLPEIRPVLDILIGRKEVEKL